MREQKPLYPADRASAEHPASSQPIVRGVVRRIGRGTGLAALGAVVGFGMANGAGVETQVDGLSVESQLTYGNGAVGDFEPLGMIRKDLGLPMNLGLTVEATDIPTRPAEQEQLLAAFGDIEAIEASIDYLRERTLGGLKGGAGRGALCGLIIGLAYDRRYAKRLSYPMIASFGAGGAAAAMFMGVVQPSEALSDEDWRVASSSIVGFDTMGIEVTGNGLNFALDEIEKNESFFNTAADNMAVTLETIAAEAAARGQKVWIFETDFHCRSGMAGVIGRAAEVTNAELVASAGDFAPSGEPIEGFCPYIYNRAIPVTVKYKVAGLGGHDSSNTRDVLEDGGFTVLNGEPVSIAGMTWIGYPDPIRTMTGRPQGLRDSGETVIAFERRVNDEICDFDDQPDILLQHDLRNVQDAIDDGCTRNALGGHMHSQIGPTINEEGTLSYTAAHSGGSVRNTPSVVGPLDTPSTLTLVFVSDVPEGETSVLEGMQTVTTELDATTSLGAYITWSGRTVTDPRMQRVE